MSGGGEKRRDGKEEKRMGRPAVRVGREGKPVRVSFTAPEGGGLSLSAAEFAAKRERMEAERAAVFLDAKRRERSSSEGTGEGPPSEEQLVLAGHRLLSSLLLGGRSGATLLGEDGDPELLLAYLGLLIRMASDASAASVSGSVSNSELAELTQTEPSVPGSS